MTHRIGSERNEVVRMRGSTRQVVCRAGRWSVAGLLVLGLWGCAVAVPEDGQPSGPDPAEKEPVDEQPAARDPADGEPANGEPVDGGPGDGGPGDGDPVDGDPVDGEPVDREPTVDQPNGSRHRGSDLAEGWTVIEGFRWPVEPGCCGMETVGPTSPEGPIPQDRWPADGYYEARARRPAEHPSMLRLTLRRWVSCDDFPESPCAPDPPPDPMTGEDARIAGDPTSEVVREVPIASLRVVLIPIHDFGLEEQRALDGAPGAFSTLISSGIDDAYRRWVYEPYLAGASPAAIHRELLERSADPDFPFGIDYCGDYESCGPLAYRGPFGTSILADPMWGAWGQLSLWPPGSDGLYAWSIVTLEVRGGEPILYVWAGPIAG